MCDPKRPISQPSALSRTLPTKHKVDCQKTLNPLRPPSQLTSLGSELRWPLVAHVPGGSGLLLVSDKPLKSSLKAAFLHPLVSGSEQQASGGAALGPSAQLF